LGKINIVLLEPEIPQNTGNIARTCAATGASLHLIEPLGFTVTDAKLKRAGLDYWEFLDITYYKNINDFYEKTGGGDYFYFTTKAPKAYTEVQYGDNSYLIFGKETAGIPESILEKNLDRCVRIPMKQDLRSLNLSNAAAIAVYEVLRQDGFSTLLQAGKYGNI
jgi:rRNA methylase, putative, group 2